MDHLQIIGQKEVEIHQLKAQKEQAEMFFQRAVGAFQALKEGTMSLDQIEIVEGGFKINAPVKEADA